ncbi:MAG: FAD-dependent oxidoreductase [Pseudomonadales bacterium]|jgi:glycine/D-amino acid oxidase-like deaminating enzyme|nr:FAD-dependent oxidoreductase [Pseudomonadales bacterium]
MSAPIDLDVLVVGGGIAGLWAMRRLQDAGYVCALVERDAIGAGQSRAAQGIIHGGLKYALGGTAGARRNPTASGLAAMPERWRASLAGRAEPDLREVPGPDRCCWLWADRSLGGRLASVLASRFLRERARLVERPQWPAFLCATDFDGLALRLDEPVVDVPAVLSALAAPLTARLLRLPDAAARLARTSDAILLELDAATLRARSIVLCAGAGNAALQGALGVDGPPQCLRPLHQVCVETAWPHAVFGHCLTGQRGSEPPLTITTHDGGEGSLLYLGGALATAGVDRSRAKQIDAARRALARALPGAPLADAPMTTLRIDRAEPATAGRRRTDEAFLAQQDGVFTAWPRKLALAPRLAERLLLALPPPERDAPARGQRLDEALAGLERPALAPPFRMAAT